MMKVVKVLFLLFLAAFLLGGFVLVSGQVLGVLTLSSSVVSGIDVAISGVTFAAATACALCAFVLQYSKSGSAEED